MSGLLTTLGGAAPGWVFVAATCFALALLCSAAGWFVALQACGGRARFHEVSGRYAIGSLVNAFAPAHLGGATRIGLLSRTLPGSDRVVRAGGVGAVLALARLAALGVLVAVAAAAGRIPIWPAPALGAGALAAFAVARRTQPHLVGRLHHGLQIFGSVRACGTACAWIGASFVARVAAGCAIVAAFGVARPVSVAVVLVWAIAIAGVLPLTPGNLGVGAGAASVALHTMGVGVDTALALGLAFQAAETAAGVSLGLAGAVVVSAPRTHTRRLAIAGVSACALAAATIGGIAGLDLV